MFGKKGKSREELIAEAQELNDEPDKEEKKDEVTTGNQKVDIELTKIQGRLEGLDEVRKASSERFSRVAEQIGELRGMIVDTNKAMSKVEVSATKAVDLVESVHPEKLMIEVRKQDGKVESLRASIESNEAIMKDLMLELKKMRDKMSFYKGIEQVIELNEEIKQELATIKKVEATIERHADKVETIFVEVEKKFSDFDKFNDVVKDLDKSFKRLASDFEKVRAKTETKLDRKEFVDLMDRFNEFEKHTTNLLKLLDERNKTVKGELQAEFKKLVKEYKTKLDKMQPKPLKEVEEEIREEVKKEVKEESGDGSGEDSAGGDIKQSLGSRVKSWFKKPEQEEGENVMPEDEETEKELEELEKAGKKDEGESAEKPEKESAEKSEEESAEKHEEQEKSEEQEKPGEKPADETPPEQTEQEGGTTEGETPDEQPAEDTTEKQSSSENEEKSEWAESDEPEAGAPAASKPQGRFEKKSRWKK